MKKRQLSIAFDDEPVRFVEAGVNGNSITTIYRSFIIDNVSLIQDGILDKTE